MSTDEVLKMDQTGYNAYLQAIAKKEKELAEVRKYKGTDAIYQGDNWHDNPILYQTELKEMALMKELCEMRKKLTQIEIVESVNDPTIVDIGDIVKLSILYDVDDVEIEMYKLVAMSPDFKAEIKEISINSPLGSAIYKRKVGERVSYKVQNNEFFVDIQEKLTLNNQNDLSRTLKMEKKQ